MAPTGRAGEERAGREPSDAPTAGPSRPGDAYWRTNLRLIAVLLAVWAAVSYGASIFAVEWLNRFSLGGLPLGFWFGQQGAIFTFVVLIFVYAWCMDRVDRRHGVDE